ncbi:hypothetical protein ACSSS7_003343 [Eimeria intestinalis]
MESADGPKAPASAVYDSVPLKPSEKQESGSGKNVSPGPPADSARVRSAVSGQGYKENLEELQKILKLLESERSQMSQRQEHLQVILDEIAALKEQTALENDLNVLMVQFIVVAVRLLVEAAFNKDKGVSSSESLKKKEGRSSGAGVGTSSTSSRLPPRLTTAPLPSSFSGESLPVKGAAASGEGRSNERGEQSSSPREEGGRTTLVDESDDERKRSDRSSSGERSLSAAANNDENTQIRLSKTSASAEFSPRRESVFTPKERRRTATAFGDGDLPLFQQFAVAAAAPAPDAFSGLRQPMDTATLSKSCRGSGSVAYMGMHAEALGTQGGAGTVDANANTMSSSGRFNRNRGRTSSGEGLRGATSSDRNEEEGLQEGLSEGGRTPGMGGTSGESSLSVDGLLKHATTILSMSPSELRAALLQSASGAKFYSGIKQADLQGEGSSSGGGKEGLNAPAADRLDSEGPLAPMSSLVESTSNKDQLQLLQEAVVAMARAVSGDFIDNNSSSSKQQQEESGTSSSSSNSAAEPVAVAAAGTNQQHRQDDITQPEEEGSANPPPPPPAGAADDRAKGMYESSSSSFQVKESNAPLHAGNQQTAASCRSPVVSSPFGGRIAPPSTPDGFTYACDQINQSAAPGHISGVYVHPDQKQWQPFYHDAAVAAAQQQRKDHALLESHYISSPTHWTGGHVGGPPYGAPAGVCIASLEKGGGGGLLPSSEALLDSDRFVGNTYVYGTVKGNKNINMTSPPSVGSSLIGAPVSGVLAPPVAGILPPVKIANPRARSATVQEQQRSCCPPRVLVPCMLRWNGRQKTTDTINTPNNTNNNNNYNNYDNDNNNYNNTRGHREIPFETPRVEGGWACCKGLTCESKGPSKEVSDK